ncbi:MAG: hypothetical protein LBS97_01890 [Treponema sp.]|nr:hypothetical protein [Treponema sp.]
MKGKIVGYYEIIEGLFIAFKLCFIDLVINSYGNILCLNIAYRYFIAGNDVIGRTAVYVFRFVGYGQAAGNCFKKALEGASVAVFRAFAGTIDFIEFGDILVYFMVWGHGPSL